MIFGAFEGTPVGKFELKKDCLTFDIGDTCLHRTIQGLNPRVLS